MSSATTNQRLPVYVVDTHAFYWYLQNPKRLSPAADAIFRLTEKGGAKIIIPAIVIAEIYYVAKKQKYSLSLSKLINDIDASDIYVISPLDKEQLICFEKLQDVDEMHDRLIAAEALKSKAIVVSKDEVLTNCSSVTTVW